VSSCRCGFQQAAPVPEQITQAAPPPPATIAPAAATPSRRVASPIVMIASVVVAILATAGVSAWWWTGRAHGNSAPAPANAALAASPAKSSSARTTPPVIVSEPPPAAAKFDLADAPVASIEELVTRTMPAVVTVETGDGLGSGFFVSPDTVVTNKHVVEGNTAVMVRKSTGGTVHANVINSSWDFDLAILKLEVVNPTQVSLPLALSSDAHLGAEVIAIGSPLGLRNTVTRGIISGTRDYRGISVIQTDAAINPGNSGGPLIDREGRVIGVNTLKLAGDALQSLGFAVSVQYVRRMLGADFALKSEMEIQREQQLAAYEKDIAALALRADEVEKRWQGFRSSCLVDPDAVPSMSREWFGLADGQTFTLHEVARCRSWSGYFKESAQSVHDALREVETRAAARGLAVSFTRQVRRKYKMFWPDWDR
jgi:S1-C subfamily serine protease